MWSFLTSTRRFAAPAGQSPRRNLGGLGRLLAWNGPLVTLLALGLSLLAGLLLARLPLLDGVLFVGLAVVGVATVIEPRVGLVAALFLGPLRAYLQTEVPQVPAQIGQLFVVLTVAAWLAQGLARRDLRIPHPPLLGPLLLFFGAALISLWDAVELPLYGVPELVKWVQILLLFLFVSQTLGVGIDRAVPAGFETRLASQAGGETDTSSRSRAVDARTTRLSDSTELVKVSKSRSGPIPSAIRNRLTWLLGALLLTGLFQAGVGMWQFGLRGEGPDHFAILGDRFYRAYGTFEQPNPYAGYLGLMVPLALGGTWGILASWWESRRVNEEGVDEERVNEAPHLPIPHLLIPHLLIYLIPSAAMLAALAMSWSRGAWLGFGAALAVMAIALPRKARWGILLVTVLVVGGLGLFATGLVPPSIAARLTGFAQYVQFEDVRGVGINDANYAVIERLAHWQAALEMFRYNVWTGVGLGCYEPAYADVALINWPIPLGHAHNYYLTVAAETGLVGLVAYVFLWGAVFWQTWRATRRARGFLRGIAIGLLGAWTHLSVHHLLDNLYVNNVHLHIGVLLGLLAFVVQQTGESANQQIGKSANQPGHQVTNCDC
jgi:O-antigen ligase